MSNSPSTFLPTTDVDIHAGNWINEPVTHLSDAPALTIAAVNGTDLWCSTYYGFTRHSAPACLFDLDVGSAIEVDFRASMTSLYDQAGILVRADGDHWIKAGIEFSDGAPQLGAVVTRQVSDWSCAPVPHWQDALITVRASRSPDSVIIRARRPGEDWRLVRLAPFVSPGPVQAGPYCAAPEGPGLVVVFRRIAVGPADPDLHL